jgi:hypothetical protein
MDDRIPEEGVDDDVLGDGDAGDTAGWVDPADGDVDYAADDPIAEKEFADDLVTTDAVAGETVWPGAGDGNDGPTGGAPREASPLYDEHDLDGDEGVLTDEDVDEQGI